MNVKAFAYRHIDALTVFVVMACLLAGSMANTHHLKAELAKERDCAKSTICQDAQAESESRLTENPVHSNTGRWYFQGKDCAGDCQEMVAGYRWAERLGATSTSACSGTPDFVAGCLAYIGLPTEEADPGPEPS